MADRQMSREINRWMTRDANNSKEENERNSDGSETENEKTGIGPKGRRPLWARIEHFFYRCLIC